MKYSYTLFVFLVVAFACDTASNIKPPDQKYFVKYFGGDGNQTAVGLMTNNDGTFFILGNSRQAAGALQKVYLAKADARGNLIWQTTYGDAEMDARDFVIAGGSIVVAANRLSAGVTDIQLIRFDLNGDTATANTTTILKMPSSSTQVNSIVALSNGDFLISGNTNYVTLSKHKQDALQFRTDKDFNQRTLLWQDTYGSGTSNDEVKAFEAPSDTLFYFFGSTNASPSPATSDQNFWTFSLHSSSGATDGNSDDKSYTDSRYDDIVTNVQKIPSGGYLMTGISTDNSQNQNLKLIKLANDQLAFDSTDIQLKYDSNSGALGRGITPFATSCNSTPGSYFVLANANNTNPSGNSDMILIKLYEDFATQKLKESWSGPVVLGGDGDDTAAAVTQLSSGQIMILGTMNIGKPAEQNKIVLMKLNSNGKLGE